MNIYLLNATQTAFLPAHLLVDKLPIKGLIGLNNNKTNRAYNEYYDYSAFCRDNSIAYIPLDSYAMTDSGDKAKLLALDIDVILVVSWQRLVPNWLLEHCCIGVVGSHGSPMGISQGRGRSPQNWALLLGCQSFSYSIFWIDPGVDSGDIIDTCTFAYTETDDIMTSYIKAGLAMADMMIKSYHSGKLQQHFGTPQSAEKSYYFPQRTQEDGMIDWTKSARFLYDFVRALTRPYPGAFTRIGGHTVTIWGGKYIETEDDGPLAAPAGQILLVYPQGELLIACGQGLFLATDYETDDPSLLAAGACFESACFEDQLQAIVDRHSAKYPFPVSPLITTLLLTPQGENE